jgi:hypothetical protein
MVNAALLPSPSVGSSVTVPPPVTENWMISVRSIRGSMCSTNIGISERTPRRTRFRIRGLPDRPSTNKLETHSVSRIHEGNRLCPPPPSLTAGVTAAGFDCRTERVSEPLTEIRSGTSQSTAVQTSHHGAPVVCCKSRRSSHHGWDYAQPPLGLSTDRLEKTGRPQMNADKRR